MNKILYIIAIICMLIASWFLVEGFGRVKNKFDGALSMIMSFGSLFAIGMSYETFRLMIAESFSIESIILFIVPVAAAIGFYFAIYFFALKNLYIKYKIRIILSYLVMLGYLFIP